MSKNPKAAASAIPTPPVTSALSKTIAFEMVKVPTKKAHELVKGEETAVALVGPVMSVKEMMEAMPEEILGMGVKGRGMILGVSPVLIFKAFLTHLIAARLAGNPAPLVYCGVLAVATAYTVSRDWVEEYGEIPEPHMFTEFEISGRTKVRATETTAAVDWVADSNMNAAALRVFGSMIVEAGQSSGFLKHVKETAGTIFDPPEGEKERDMIMREASKTLSEADRQAMQVFSNTFAKYAAVVGAVFGGGDVDFQTYMEVAETLGELTI